MRLFATAVLLFACFVPIASVKAADPLRQENLVAWCIVPFDAAKRTPEQRAVMLEELGIGRCAYDWRAEHVPTFEQEIEAYQKHNIEFFAFWGVHEEAFKLFEKYDLHPQIWLMLPQPEGNSQEEKVPSAVRNLTPLAKRAKELGCELGIYNHGGWSGEPRNMVDVCQAMRQEGFDNVGIVYNFHHGHEHIADFAESFKQMKPYLLCVNLNGMNDNAQPKILGIGKGKYERGMIKTVLESGYDGPIGILDHRNELDSKESLQENLSGLAELRAKLSPKSTISTAPNMIGD